MHKTFTIIFLCCFSVNLQAQLPDNFFDEIIIDDLQAPVGITFDQNGTGYVWERAGKVYLIDQNGLKLSAPLLDISEEVGDWGDHGLLGFALHPDFLNNGHFYLLYVVDRHHLFYHDTNLYNPDANEYNNATIGRITRYTADGATNFKTLIPDSRKVLLGDSTGNGFPINFKIHSVGSLVFGEDGTLLASCGDTAFSLNADTGSHTETFYQQALIDGILKPKENIGSFRSQLTDCLNGKIIRIDPETGLGLPSNPFFETSNPDAPQSKVWAMGFRNPFRFSIRPGSGSSDPNSGNPGSLYVGDVGAGKFEELNIVKTGGQNFGWPLYEGYIPKDAFQNVPVQNTDAPNPIVCNQAFFNFQDLLQLPLENGNEYFANPCDTMESISESFSFVACPPALAWRNTDPALSELALTGIFDELGMSSFISLVDPASPVSGENFEGYASIGGVFYNAENFPEEYQGKYLHTDYSGWIKSIVYNNQDQIASVEDFHKNSEDVVSMAVNPLDGCLYYVSFTDNRLRKVCFGGNPRPIIIATSGQNYGAAPLSVPFDASNSYSPLGYPLSFHWDFGDNSTSTDPAPIHTFETNNNSPRQFEVKLTVTDSLGSSNNKTLIVSINNTPPVVDITSIEDHTFYPLSGYTLFDLQANVTDLEHNETELLYDWQTILHHNTHEHPDQLDHNPVSTTLIEPIGCDGDEYWFEIRLEVTDEAGLSGWDSVSIFPYCGPAIAQVINLRGKAFDQGIELHWEADIPSDSISFEIQRSDNFTVFESIGAVNSSQVGDLIPLDYFDADPLPGNNRYRIKMLNKNGIFDYSNVILILFPPDPKIRVYPNPATNQLIFDLRESAGAIKLYLFDTAGRLILKYDWTDETLDGLPRTVDVSSLPNGIYFYKIQNGIEEFMDKIMILK